MLKIIKKQIIIKIDNNEEINNIVSEEDPKLLMERMMKREKI